MTKPLSQKYGRTVRPAVAAAAGQPDGSAGKSIFGENRNGMEEGLTKTDGNTGTSAGGTGIEAEEASAPRPGLNPGKHWGRRLLDAVRGIKLNPSQRINCTRVAVALGFASGFLLSPKLWITTRFYPLIPIVRGLPRISFPLDYLCFAILFLLIVLVATVPKPRPYILGFVTLLCFLALYDQTRWQPWVYLYLFILIAFGCYSWKAGDTRGQENALNICRLIIAATYFYSGWQKVNPRFAAVGMANLLGMPDSRLPILHLMSLIVPFIEVGIGVGLLIRRYRNLAVLGGIFMHLLILYTFGILLGWNSVVWPWNVVMIAFVWGLFWNADASFSDILWQNDFRFQKVALLLFAVLPFLSFFGWWDSDLSASLYAVNLPSANVLVSETVKNELPSEIQKYVKDVPGSTRILHIQDWSFGELNVPPYAAARTYRAVGKEICRYSHNSPDVVLLLQEKDTLRGKGLLSRDTCFGTLVIDKW